MLRLNQIQKPSAVLLWGDENGHYTPIRMTKFRIALVFFALVFTSLTSLTLTSYLYFRDDILAALSLRHSQTTNAYEDRLAKMRAQTDRITSKQLIDQDHFERKMAVIVEKQTTLEAQQKIVTDITTRLGFSQETPFKKASLEGGKGSVIDSLNDVKARLEKNQMQEFNNITKIEQSIKGKSDTYIRLFSELNIPVPRINNATGGPFIPASLKADEHFTKRLVNLEQQIMQHMTLKYEVQKLPLLRPLPSSHDITSSFGTRIDPFTGGYARHSGLDFRGNTGDPVRATATGEVITARIEGGYGNMIEIEHGHDFSTRYAHLSGFNVREGDRVIAGQIIGYIGSTGRSTGAHLHYEIRRSESALDPLPFVRLNHSIQ